MSEVTHTPGPWSIDNYGAGQRIVVKGRPGFSGDYRIADAHFSSDLANCVRVREMQANARLIAAAPELYAALKEWAENPDGWNVDQVNHARAIIAKVEA